jgi:ketopantoate reductase
VGPDPSQRYDLALVTVRADQVLSALTALKPCAGIRAIVLTGNNFSDHAEQAALVGRPRFVLGFGSFGGYRDAGVIVYLDRRTARYARPEHRRPSTLGVLGPAAPLLRPDAPIEDESCALRLRLW